MSKYYDLVTYDKKLEQYKIKIPIDNQTLEMGAQKIEIKDNPWEITYQFNNTIYFNIYLIIYNKRKHFNDLMDLKKITGKDPIRSVLVARECFKALEENILEDQKINKKDVVICVYWEDNRRRDAYYKVLSKWGYEYGRLPESNMKVIKKTFKWKDNK